MVLCGLRNKYINKQTNITSIVGAFRIKQHILKTCVMQCLGNTVDGNVIAKNH